LVIKEHIRSKLSHQLPWRLPVFLHALHDVKHAFLRLGKSRLVQASGKKLAEDPIPQTIRSAEAVNAKPVLWLPKSDGKTVTVQGVVVVFGSRKRLYKAVGAKTGWQIF
jgi:hypothetical protein